MKRRGLLKSNATASGLASPVSFPYRLFLGGNQKTALDRIEPDPRSLEVFAPRYLRLACATDLWNSGRTEQRNNEFQQLEEEESK